MKTMEGILKQELIRLKETEKSYIHEIEKLPKGSFQKKRINGIDYLYLVFRNGSKVVSEYVGDRSEEDLKKLKEDIEIRKKFVKLLKETRQNIKRISGILRGRRKTV